MPTGTQAYLVVDLADGEKISRRLGLSWQDPTDQDDTWDWCDQYVEPIAQALQPDLLKVHRDLLDGEPGVAVVQMQNRYGQYFKVNTGWGPREVSPFGLGLVGDDGEMGDEFPRDFELGIALATRYYPTWLDLSASNGATTAFRLSVEALNQVDKARQAIAKIIPEFADADFEVREEFF